MYGFIGLLEWYMELLFQLKTSISLAVDFRVVWVPLGRILVSLGPPEDAKGDKDEKRWQKLFVDPPCGTRLGSLW